MTYEDNCLAHFGIRGQKWGVRRYQNEDGTLTEAGKQRYAERERDIGYAKDYAKQQITKEKEQLHFWQGKTKEAESIKPTKKNIMKFHNLSESDYNDAMLWSKTPERYMKEDIAYNKRHEKIYRERIKDWNEKIKELDSIKIDAISGRSKHQKEIENVFDKSKGWLFRTINLAGIRGALSMRRKMGDPEEYHNSTKLKAVQLRNIEKTVSNYKKAHPNTQLSYEEILYNQYGYDPRIYG